MNKFLVVKEFSCSVQMSTNYLPFLLRLLSKPSHFGNRLQGLKSWLSVLVLTVPLSQPICPPHLTSVAFPPDCPAFVCSLSLLRTFKYLCWPRTAHPQWLGLKVTFQNTSSSAHSANRMLPLHWGKSAAVSWNLQHLTSSVTPTCLLHS